MTTQSGGEADGSSAGRARWFKILLVGSLALNLLFIGGLAKAAWHHRHGGPGGHGGPGLMGFVRDLPPDRRQLIGAELKAAREAVEPMRTTVRERWSEANTVLVEEPFDKAKYKAAMDRVTEAEGQLKNAITAAMSETAAKMSPDERRALQAWRDKRKKHSFGKHRNKGEGDE